MKKRKLKPFVKISLLLVVLLVCSIGISTLINNKTKTVSKQNDDFT